MTPTRKDNKIDAVAALRMRISKRKINIHERCQNLIYQLKVGHWSNSRTTFERGEKTGHLDAIDALIYLNRSVDLRQHENPYPNPSAGVWSLSHHIPDTVREENEKLRNAFTFNRGLNGLPK